MATGTTTEFIPIPTGEMSTGQDVESDPWRAAVTDLSWLYDHYAARCPIHVFDPTWYLETQVYTTIPDDPPEGRGSTVNLGGLTPVWRPRRAIADAQFYADGVLGRFEIEATDDLLVEIDVQRVDGTGQSTTRTTVLTRTVDGATGAVDFVIPLADFNDQPFTLYINARNNGSAETYQELESLWMWEPVPVTGQYPVQFTP